MPVSILMPALAPTMEKGNLAKWLKKEGDKVKPGDVIAEIETDKATMEYESIDEGTLAKIVVPEGTQDVPVNQLIAVLAEEGEDVKAAAAAAAKGAPATKVPTAAAGSQSAAPQQEAPKPSPSLQGAQPVAAPGPAPAPMPAVHAPADERIRALFEAGSYDVVPHDTMRRVIARRLVEAKLTIPHFYLTLDCGIGKLLAAREEINALAPKDKEGKPA